MSTAEKIAEKIARLPSEQQAEVLDFVEFLASGQALRAADWPPGAFEALGLSAVADDDDAIVYDLSDCREAL